MTTKDKFESYDKSTHNELKKAIETFNNPNNSYCRFVAMRLLEIGMTPEEISEILYISTSSTEDWSEKFLKDGVEGLNRK